MTLVVAVNANGTYMRIGGDEGDHHSFSTTTVDRDGPFKSKVGNTDSGQKLSGFVRPRHVVQGNPWIPLVIDGKWDAVTKKALQRHIGVRQNGLWTPWTTKNLQQALNDGKF